MSQRKAPPTERYAAYDRSRLERELAAAEANARDLRRRLAKLEEQLTQTQQAYNKTVHNMQDIVRENLQLSHECERLRLAAQHHGWEWLETHPSLHTMSRAELSAVRKAMARLHHPDTGGDSQRMQYWNAVLDQLEQRF